MKKDIPTYLVDSFIDYKGDERKFVACALSHTPVITHSIQNENKSIKINRMITIGISVCHVDDKFDLELGKKIAFSKAKHNEGIATLYVPTEDMISSDLAEAFLKQQVKFFKENPEMIIKGYNSAKYKYLEIKQINQEIENLTEKELNIFNLALNGFDFNRIMLLAQLYEKKIVKK